MANWDRAATEFPNYPANTLPELPKGFEDTSWRKDTCPSACSDTLQLFLDYPNPTDREDPELLRYSLYRITDDGAEDILDTDNWSEMLAAIENAK